MLYGVHVFARAKVDPGPRALAGRAGLPARARDGRPRRSSSSPPAAPRWRTWTWARWTRPSRGSIARPRSPSEHPTPLRARRLETWRGHRARAAAGDAAGMRAHLERAVQLAAETGQPAARCEALARLALEAVAAGRRAGRTTSCSTLAEQRGERGDGAGGRRCPGIRRGGRRPTPSLATVALARGRRGRGRRARARSALAALQPAHARGPAPGRRCCRSRTRLVGAGAPEWEDAPRRTCS